MGFCCAAEIFLVWRLQAWRRILHYHVLFSKGIMSRKHTAQTTDQSALTSEKADWQTIKLNGGFFDLKESSVLSFDFVT